ncbi:TPA: GTP-binding protein TypA [Staphylococcus aureus]|nr:GTP-binding protein TypA [Staphylococcus aureus]
MTNKREDVRNIAIIAHVDHGKTTLVDELLKQSGIFRENEHVDERAMDSNDIERERGITILAKNTAVDYKGTRINILDTPGHADFGGEVERIMKMVDGVVLVVDAYEGTMPQTRFVLKKALEQNLKPVVVVNKIDKPSARPEGVVDEVLDLFIELEANDEQLEFPVVYASAVNGTASLDPEKQDDNLQSLYETIIDYVPAPIDNSDEPLQFQVALLDYNDYVGRIGIGRVFRGKMRVGDNVSLIKLDGTVKNFRVTKIFGYFGLKRLEIEEAQAGDLIAVSGMEDINVGETVTPHDHQEALPVLRIDEPTLEMTFKVNNSPFAGREGYELQVSKPQVIIKEIDGVMCEPFERVQCEVPQENAGAVIESLGARKGEMVDMTTTDNGLTRLIFNVPARGMIGYTTEFMSMTRGYGIINHTFEEFRPRIKAQIGGRRNGALISMDQGSASTYAILGLEDRGVNFMEPGTEVYEGMIVGEHNRENDLTVNITKTKHQTNVRSATKDQTQTMNRPRILTLEEALQFINDDELVEVTPESIRLRKKILNKNVREKEAKRIKQMMQENE